MHNIGFRVSVQWWAGIMIAGTILAWLIGIDAIDDILFLWTALTGFSICVHYLVKHMFKGWYSYYDLLYDTEQRINKLLKKIEKHKLYK